MATLASKYSGAIGEIAGDLVIRSSAENTVESLSQLFGSLVRIGGALRIYKNDNLLNCSWLGMLESVGSDVQISDNANLVSAAGLGSHLFTVSGSVRIERNPALVELGKFDSLIHVGGNLAISDCDSLQSVDTFRSLAAVGGDVYFANNALLSALSAFGAEYPLSIGGGFFVERNPVLAAAPAFANVGTVAGRLRVTSNPALQEVVMPKLSFLSSISVSENDALAVLSLEPNLASSLHEVYIRSNKLLSKKDACTIEGYCGAASRVCSAEYTSATTGAVEQCR